ncbi:MAG: hypothetical protein K2W82_14760 [Candidatus Obscuribacterales bacterium]|nr:hypothetical protein [Candidatus Obscuribacterales bacterium]
MDGGQSESPVEKRPLQKWLADRPGYQPGEDQPLPPGARPGYNDVAPIVPAGPNGPHPFVITDDRQQQQPGGGPPRPVEQSEWLRDIQKRDPNAVPGGQFDSGVRQLTDQERETINSTMNRRSSIDNMILHGAAAGVTVEYVNRQLGNIVINTPPDQRSPWMSSWEQHGPNAKALQARNERLQPLKTAVDRAEAAVEAAEQAKALIREHKLAEHQKVFQEIIDSTSDTVTAAQKQFATRQLDFMSDATKIGNLDEVVDNIKLGLFQDTAAIDLLDYANRQKAADAAKEAVINATRDYNLVKNEPFHNRLGTSYVTRGAQGALLAAGTLSAGWFTDMVLGNETKMDSGRLLVDGFLIPGTIMVPSKYLSPRVKATITVPLFVGARGKDYFSGLANHDINGFLRPNEIHAVGMPVVWLSHMTAKNKGLATAGVAAAGFAANGLGQLEDYQGYRDSLLRPNSVGLVGTAASMQFLQGKNKLYGIGASVVGNVAANAVGGLDSDIGAALRNNNYTYMGVGSLVVANQLEVKPRTAAKIVIGTELATIGWNLYTHKVGSDVPAGERISNNAYSMLEQDNKLHTQQSFENAVASWKHLSQRDTEGKLNAASMEWSSKEHQIPPAEFARKRAIFAMAYGELMLEKGSRAVIKNEKDAQKLFGDDSRMLTEHKADLFQEASIELFDARRNLIQLRDMATRKGNQAEFDQYQNLLKRVEGNLAVACGEHDTAKIFDEVKAAFRTNSEMPKILVEQQRAYEQFQSVTNPDDDEFRAFQAKTARDLALLYLASADYNVSQNNGAHAVEKMQDIERFLSRAFEIAPNHPDYKKLYDIYDRVSKMAKDSESQQYNNNSTNPFGVQDPNPASK